MRTHLAVLAVLAACVLAACDGGEGVPDARPPDAVPAMGTFSVAWSLTDTTTGGPISCDDVGATTVSISVTPSAGGTGYNEVFNCGSLMGTSRPTPIGTYSLAFSLRGPDGPIASAAGVNGVEITANQDTPVDARTFSVDATGAASLRIDTADLTNCGLVVDMGSGIETMAVTLTKGGACVAVDWTVGAGTYSAACPTPAETACIERDVDLVAASLPSGRYQVAAVGNVAAAACWAGMQELRVPTEGATVMATLTLEHQPLVPGCSPMP